MLKNRILRWMSIASCALLLCTNANATERFADDAEAFKTYGEVCFKIDQIQSLNIEFSDIDKAREYICIKLAALGTRPAKQKLKNIKSEINPEIIRNEAKTLGFHADESIQSLKTYIHEKSPLVFTYLLFSSLYKMSYEFAIQHRDVFSTLDAENAEIISSTASTWIAEIQAKATAEVEQIGNVVYALFLEKALQTTEHMKATRIIDSFKTVDADFHGQLNARFYAIVNKKTPIVPFAAERLIFQREVEDLVFRINDEENDDA